ncbi:hypothetical protein V8E54_013792 [Elaphomyces granulatus]
MQIIQAIVLAAIAISGVFSAPPPPQTVSNVVSGRGPPPPPKQNNDAISISCSGNANPYCCHVDPSLFEYVICIIIIESDGYICLEIAICYESDAPQIKLVESSLQKLQPTGTNSTG